MEREVVKVSGDDFGDFTSNGPWYVNGETYTLVKQINNTPHCDGECWEVIVKRESDQKYFKFDWWDAGYHNGYIFCDGSDGLTEVFPKQVITVTYE